MPVPKFFGSGNIVLYLFMHIYTNDLDVVNLSIEFQEQKFLLLEITSLMYIHLYHYFNHDLAVNNLCCRSFVTFIYCLDRIYVRFMRF